LDDGPRPRHGQVTPRAGPVRAEADHLAPAVAGAGTADLDPVADRVGGRRPGPNDGDLFSNTATSKLSGISVGRPGVEGASGSRSSGGRNARFWRAVAIEIHSPVSGSSRSSGAGGLGAGGRSSA